MDNLGELGALLTPLLSNPETMNSLRQAAEQMGLGGLLPESPETDSDENREATEQAQRNESVADKGESMGDLFSAVTKLAPLLSAPKEDETTRLLSALRPFLSQERARKLDEAERMLSLTRVLSILKESKLM